MIGTKRNFDTGQAIILIPTFLALILAFLLGTIKIAQISKGQIELQNSADIASMAGSTWIATGLNLIAGLNKGIVVANSGEKTIRSIGKAIHICTAIFGLCSSLETIYQNVGKKLLKFFHNTALNLKEMQIEIADTIPILALEETSKMGKANRDKITVPFPAIPNGPKDSDQSLYLHVKNLEKDSTEPVELEDDYRDRSNIKVSSCNSASCIEAISTVIQDPQQKPEDLMHMTWKAKLYQ